MSTNCLNDIVKIQKIGSTKKPMNKRIIALFSEVFPIFFTLTISILYYLAALKTV